MKFCKYSPHSATGYLQNHLLRENFIFGTLNSFNYFVYLHIIRVVRGHYSPNCKRSAELESHIVCLFRILINSVGSYILFHGIRIQPTKATPKIYTHGKKLSFDFTQWILNLFQLIFFCYNGSQIFHGAIYFISVYAHDIIWWCLWFQKCSPLYEKKLFQVEKSVSWYEQKVIKKIEYLMVIEIGSARCW